MLVFIKKVYCTWKNDNEGIISTSHCFINVSLQGVGNTLFTLHMNHLLPVHVMRTKEADEFYTQHVGTPELGVSQGKGWMQTSVPFLQVKLHFRLKPFKSCRSNMLFHFCFSTVQFYSPQAKFRGCIGITLPICPSICPCFVSATPPSKPILMKLYTVAVYDLKVCMKEDNHDPNYFKGDN